MTNTTIDQELGQRIERVVQEHIAAIHGTAREALERAFVSVGRAPQRAIRGNPRASVGKRRAPVELSALVERLYVGVCAKPGETMIVLARELGAPSRELSRPMKGLLRSGRVRSAGQRNHTRYFPRGNAST